MLAEQEEQEIYQRGDLSVLSLSFQNDHEDYDQDIEAVFSRMTELINNSG